MMKEKIKDIYSCRPLYENHPLYGSDPLVVWHNQVIEKYADELTIADVARCIRQNVFVEKAYEMLLVYLLNNPYEGDIYDGELMDKASEVDKDIIVKYKKTIAEIIENAEQFIHTYDWQYEEDKIEFEQSVERLYDKIYLQNER